MQQRDFEIFICQEHNEQIISFQQNEHGIVQMYCNQCLNKSKVKIDEFPKILNQIVQEKIGKIKQGRGNIQKEMKQFGDFFVKIQKEFTEIFNEIVSQINQQIDLFSKETEEQIQDLMEISKINQLFKLNSQIKCLRDYKIHIDEQAAVKLKLNVFKQLEQVSNSLIRMCQERIKTNQTQYELQYQQTEMFDCRSIIMIKNETIMINGSGTDIQMWFVGKNMCEFTLHKTFSNHSRIIRRLFPYQNDQFISCSADSIILWKEVENLDWRPIQQLEFQKFSDGCSNFQLNNSQLFAFNFYSQKHYYINVEGLILETEINPIIEFYTQLLAICPLYQQFRNGIIGKLDFGNIYIQGVGPFNRLSHTDQDEIVGTTRNGEFYSYQINYPQQYNMKQKLILNTDKEQDQYIFPIVYHSKLKIVICRHAQITYILKKGLDDQYTIIQEFKGAYRSCYISKYGSFIIFRKTWPNQLEVWKLQ